MHGLHYTGSLMRSRTDHVSKVRERALI